MNHGRALLAVLLGCAIAPLRAQTKEQASAAADGVVAALKAKDPKLLKPLLSDQCTVPGLTPAQFAGVVDAVVATWSWQFTGHRIELKATDRVLVTLDAPDKSELAFTMQLDAAGKIVELPLFATEAGDGERTVVFAGPASSVVPLVRYGELWAVRAKLAGKEGLWLIDSGAPRLVLDASAFPAAQDTDPGTSRTFTFPRSVSGVSTGTEIREVGPFEIADQVATKVRAGRLDLAHLTQRDDKGEPIPLLGLLGTCELAAFETRFDFDAATLTLVGLNDAGEPVVPRPTRLTERHGFVLHDHLPLLRFTAGEAQLGLVFDTGAASNVLHERHAADPALSLDNVATALLSGISSDTPSVKIADVSGLRIDGRVLPPMRTVFFATMAVDGTDGIAGLPWIAGRPFALNYAHKCIVFGPRGDAQTSR